MTTVPAAPLGAPPNNPISLSSAHRDERLNAPSHDIKVDNKAPPTPVYVTPSNGKSQTLSHEKIAVLLAMSQSPSGDSSSVDPSLDPTSPPSGEVPSASQITQAAANDTAQAASATQDAADEFLAKLRETKLTGLTLNPKLLQGFKTRLDAASDAIDASKPQDGQARINRKGSQIVARRLNKALKKSLKVLRSIEQGEFDEHDLKHLQRGLKVLTREEKKKRRRDQLAKFQNSLSPLKAYTDHANNPLHKVDWDAKPTVTTSSNATATNTTAAASSAPPPGFDSSALPPSSDPSSIPAHLDPANFPSDPSAPHTDPSTSAPPAGAVDPSPHPSDPSAGAAPPPGATVDPSAPPATSAPAPSDAPAPTTTSSAPSAPPASAPPALLETRQRKRHGQLPVNDEERAFVDSVVDAVLGQPRQSQGRVNRAGKLCPGCEEIKYNKDSPLSKHDHQMLVSQHSDLPLRDVPHHGQRVLDEASLMVADAESRQKERLDKYPPQESLLQFDFRN